MFSRPMISERAADPWWERPIAGVVMGALAIGSSGVLVRLADATPATVALYRCLFAVPFLGAIAWRQNLRYGPLSSHARNLAWIAGFFFFLDLLFWHHAIYAVGAGLATVLGNLQIVIVAFVAWALLHERPHAGLFAAVPVVLIGVVLVSGAIGADAYGEDPVLGVIFGVATAIVYSAFILILRQGSSDQSRTAGTLFHATVSATLFTALYGLLLPNKMTWGPPAETLGWLFALALASQVIGWLLIGRSLPRLPAAVTSVILLLQPVAAMVIAAIVVDERPSPTQLVGAAAILVGVVVATRGQKKPTGPPP